MSTGKTVAEELKKRVAVIFNSAYLQVPLWVWFFTVFTFYDPPFARVCHMAIFLVTSNKKQFSGVSSRGLKWESKTYKLKMSIFVEGVTKNPGKKYILCRVVIQLNHLS